MMFLKGALLDVVNTASEMMVFNTLAADTKRTWTVEDLANATNVDRTLLRMSDTVGHRLRDLLLANVASDRSDSALSQRLWSRSRSRAGHIHRQPHHGTSYDSDLHIWHASQVRTS